MFSGFFVSAQRGGGHGPEVSEGKNLPGANSGAASAAPRRVAAMDGATQSDASGVFLRNLPPMPASGAVPHSGQPTLRNKNIAVIPRR